MNKKDFKYIIKRILIGVGIIFIVAFIKKCNVHAEELIDLHVNLSGLTCPTSDYDYSYFEDITSFTIDNYNITFKFQPGLYTSQNTLVMLFKNQDSYIAYTANSFNPVFIDSVLTTLDISYIDFTSLGYNFYDSQNSLLYSSNKPLQFSQFLTYTTNSNNNFDFIVNDFDYYNYNCSDNIPNLYTNAYNTGNDFDILYSSTYDLLGYLLENYSLIYTNIPISYDSIPVLPDDTIGSDININANYNLNNCDSLVFDDNNCSLNKFFSTGLFINDIPYNINIYSDLTIYENVYYSVFRLKNRYNRYEYGYLVFSPRQPDFRVVKVDIDIDENTGNLSYKFYDELGELNNNSFYINSFIITDLDDIPDTVISNYHYTDLDSLKLSYSTDIFIHTDFNLNFFQSYDLYYSNITFMNINGTPIEEFYRLRSQSLMQEGINNGGSSWVNDQIDDSENSKSNFLESLISIVKLPFKFLNDSVTLTCTKLSLPIPFLNTTIDIPCMKTLYMNVLGNYYEIFSIVINAFVLYRIAINVTSTVKDIVDPTIDRIGVLDL